MSFTKIQTNLLTILLFLGTSSFSQSYFKKKYFVPECVSFAQNSVGLLRSTMNNNPANVCNSPLYVGTLNQTKDAFTNKLPYRFTGSYFSKIRTKASGKTRYIKANVKSNGKLLIVNPWLGGNGANRNSDFAFELDNRQELKLSYTQYAIVPITIPVKVQFGKDNSTNFSSGIELGGLVGWSWGRTKFTYRKNLDNFARSHEFTLGALFSFQGIEIDLGNETTRKTVATSVGLGAIYSYEKINLGLTGGVEYAHGFGADKWNFQGRPWIGVLIGYSIFD